MCHKTFLFRLFTRKPGKIKCIWQVFWLGLNRTPSHPAGGVTVVWRSGKSDGNRWLPFTNLTATGIAPELHRTSLLIPLNGNQIRCKDDGRLYKKQIMPVWDREKW